jgi:hypothetical protein
MTVKPEPLPQVEVGRRDTPFEEVRPGITADVVEKEIRVEADAAPKVGRGLETPDG